MSYAYDSGDNAKGHLTSLLDQAGTATYTYDILGRLASETRHAHRSQQRVDREDRQLRVQPRWLALQAALSQRRGGDLHAGFSRADVSAVDSGSDINYVTGATYGPDSALTGFVSGNSGTFAGITNSLRLQQALAAADHVGHCAQPDGLFASAMTSMPETALQAAEQTTATSSASTTTKTQPTVATRRLPMTH